MTRGGISGRPHGMVDQRSRMFLLRWCDGARSVPSPVTRHPSPVACRFLGSELQELLGRIGVPAVGKTSELGRVTLLRCEFDELVGGAQPHRAG